MQAEIRRKIRDPDLLVTICLVAGQRGHVDVDLGVDVMPGRRQLLRRIVRLADHRQRGSRLSHEVRIDAFDGRKHGPLALLAPQEHPVVQHVRLVRLHPQTFRQARQRIGVTPLVFMDAPEVVERGQPQRPLLGMISRRVLHDPRPFRDRRVELVDALAHDTQIEMRMNEIGRELDGRVVCLFRGLDVIGVEKRDAKVEVHEMIERRDVALEPGPVKDRRQLELPVRFERARALEETRHVDLAVPREQKIGSKIFFRRNHDFTHTQYRKVRQSAGRLPVSRRAGTTARRLLACP
nr:MULTISPECIES: hypothetical protein [unclassified Burkholderia]